jgi:hypothetical protein
MDSRSASPAEHQKTPRFSLSNRFGEISTVAREICERGRVEIGLQYRILAIQLEAPARRGDRPDC